MMAWLLIQLSRTPDRHIENPDVQTRVGVGVQLYQRRVGADKGGEISSCAAAISLANGVHLGELWKILDPKSDPEFQGPNWFT